VKGRHFIGVVFLIAIVVAMCRPQRDDYVELSDDDAFTVAVHALAIAKITGCGDLEITSQLGHDINVRCGDGRIHTITNGPATLKVDGKIVEY